MSAHRTWACVYNVNSWCLYTSKTHACYGQDLAPDGKHHELVLGYRHLEQIHWRERESTRRQPLDLASAKKELLLAVGESALTVCAFYPEYKHNDREAIINRTDMAIPKLLTRKAVRIKGQVDATTPRDVGDPGPGVFEV